MRVFVALSSFLFERHAANEQDYACLATLGIILMENMKADHGNRCKTHVSSLSKQVL